MQSNLQTMEAFLIEVSRREKEKADYFVPTNKSLMVLDENEPKLELERLESFGLTELAHRQIADRLNIPKKYYDRMMKVAPELLLSNVNNWLQIEPENRLVRTMDGKIRAYLSDRYKEMDNFFVMSAFLPTLKQHQDLMVMSHSLTDNRMYIQFQFPKLRGEVKVGDTVTAGIVITNSEVGLGALDIREMIWRLSCSNGMITSSLKRSTHLGGNIGYEVYYSQDTMEKRRMALQGELKDVFSNAITQASFDKKLIELRQATKDVIENRPTEFIKKVVRKFSLSETDGENVLLNMYKEGNLNRYGLINGVTYLSHGTENRDKQFEFESMANDIIELKPSEWKVLAA